MSKRIARKRPSAESATSPVEKLSRPCESPVKWSMRSATHLTGRPRRRAASAASAYSRYMKLLVPKPPPTSRRDHPDLRRVDLQHLVRERVAQAVDALARDRQGEALGRGVIGRDDAAGFHEVGDQPVVLDRDRGAAGRLGEGLLDGGFVAEARIEGDVVRGFAPDRRRAVPDRPAQVDDRRQHLVVDADRLDAVPCRRDVVGDDEGDGVADVPHGVAGEHRDVRQMPLAAAVVRHRRLAGNVAEMRDVGRRQHQPARRGWRAPPPGR